MDGTEFSREIRKAKTPDERVAWFGALLRKEAGTDVEVVGGSAIEIYLTSSAYVSDDIDIVGNPRAVENALRTWEFDQVKGRSQRIYWTHPGVGLVDLVGAADRSGLPPRRVMTPHGPVTLSAPEPLIVRRLFRAKREKSAELFRQAVALGRQKDLDWDYLESEARYEGVGSDLLKLRKILRG